MAVCIAIFSGEATADPDAVYDLLYLGLPTAEDKGCGLQSPWLVENLKFNDPGQRLDLLLGDRHISFGLTEDRVAGLDLATEVDEFWSITAFGGVPTTPVMEKGVVNNLIYGGRIQAKPASACEIGVSVLRDHGQGYAEEGSADVKLDIGPSLTLGGLSRYKVDAWREHRYSARLRYLSFELTPLYEFAYSQDKADQFRTDFHLYGFLKNRDETVRVCGTDLSWQSRDRLTIGLRSRRFDYGIRDESALYNEGLISLEPSPGSRFGLEIGRMQGQSAATVYTLVGADLRSHHPFGLKDSYWGAVVRYLDYDRTVHGHHFALHTTLDLGYRFFNGGLDTKLSAIFRADPYFEDEIGALLSIQFQR